MRSSARADFTSVLDASLSKLREDLIHRFCSLVSDLQAENEELKRRLEDHEELRRRLEETESRLQTAAPPSDDGEQAQEDDRVGGLLGLLSEAEADPEAAPRPPTPPRVKPTSRSAARRGGSPARSPQRSSTRAPYVHNDDRDDNDAGRRLPGRPTQPPAARQGARDERTRDSERSRSPLLRRPPPAPPRDRSLSRNRPKGSGKGKDGKEGGSLCFFYLRGNCKNNQCADRHPDRDEAKSLLDKMQNTPCKWGQDCRRRDCIFSHPDRY